MKCARPLYAWESKTVNPSGARSLVFYENHGVPGSGRDVPCGKCFPCRMNASRDLSVRLIHELQFSERACVATHTLDDEHLVDTVEELREQIHLVKLRAKRRGVNPRSFWLLEYGGRFGRVHAHAIWFHEDFRELGMYYHNRRRSSGDVLGDIRDDDGATRGKSRFYASDVMDDIWRMGHTQLDAISPAACRYVCGHTQGKLLVDRVRPDGTFAWHVIPAARPAVGIRFAKQFASDMIAVNAAVINGNKTAVPRAYLKRFPELFESIKEYKRQYAIEHDEGFHHTIYSGDLAQEKARLQIIQGAEARAWHAASHRH